MTSSRRPGTSRGFTIIELMVVVAIIGVLVGMIMSGVQLAKRAVLRTEARITLQEFQKCLVNMKRNYDYDGLLGAYTSGRTTVSTRTFTDLGTTTPERNFTKGGIAAGDKLMILSGKSGGERNIASKDSDTQLTVDGDPFVASEINLDYYIKKGDGTLFPAIDIAKELDPKNKEWETTFVPHLNSRGNHYFNCRKARIKGGDYQDPWGHLYVYRLEQLVDGPVTFILEKVICSGQDGRLHAEGQPLGDDYEIVVCRWRLGG